MTTMRSRQEKMNKCYHKSHVDSEYTKWCGFACSHKVSCGFMDCCYVHEL